MTTTETEAFLAQMMPAQAAAERAMHEGDPEPRIGQWSHQDPVTLLGAKWTAVGWAEVEPAFRRVAALFADPVGYEIELIAAGASGDLAYTVVYEHNQVVAEGKPREYTLRVTHVYRREDGAWHIVHRHADWPPDPEAPLFPDKARRGG